MTEPPKKPRGYLMSAIVMHMHDLMAWSGHPVPQILQKAGLTREDLTPRSGRMPIDQVARLLHAALDTTGDPQLMLKLSQVTFSDGFGVIGYLAQACPTLQDAADNFVRFSPLISNIGGPRLANEPGQLVWEVVIDHEDPMVVRQGVEYFFGAGYRFLLLADARRSDVVREIRFAHPAPTDPVQRAVYEKVFSVPVRFGAGHSAIVVHARAMSVRMRQPDVMVKEAVKQQAEKKLSELDGEPAFPALVRKEIEMLVLSQQASRETLAERLGVSSRHLGRLLTNAGLGYRELVDEIRLSIARDRLLKTESTVADIGELLGFGDSPSFIRWFRNETGQTPGDFRQQEK